jgi:hypothetical protein
MYQTINCANWSVNMYRVDGEKVIFGPEEWQWVGFYATIRNTEVSLDGNDLKVTTDCGEYLLCQFRNPIYAATLSGKTIKEFQQERFPHLFNEDGTWIKS